MNVSNEAAKSYTCPSECAATHGGREHGAPTIPDLITISQEAKA